MTTQPELLPKGGPALSPDPAWNKEFVKQMEAMAPVQPTPMTMLQTLIDKGADADAICKISDLAEKWLAKEAKEAWHRAVAGFKSEVEVIVKRNEVKDRGGNVIYKFAGYDDIKAVTVPKERKWGIVTGFSFDNSAPGILKATLKITVGSHTEEFTGAVPVPTAAAGGINASQLMGQAHSYVKRYLYLAAFDLLVAGEDSDAMGMIDTISDDQVGLINDAIEDCRKAGKWDEERSLKSLCRVYSIDNIGELPAARLRDLLADLDRQLTGKAKK